MTTGILLLHGFSGGPYEVEPFAQYIKEHTDWDIELPTFVGHGDADNLAMKGYKAAHWLMDAELAYRRLAKRVDEVIVAGFSMGGVIAMHIAMRYRVKKLVLMSAAAKYASPVQLAKDIQMMAVEAFKGKLRDNELFARYEFKFRNVPLTAVKEFTKVVRATAPYFTQITCPVFIVQGRLDGIVPAMTGQLLYEKIAAVEKELYISETGKHHICYSTDCVMWFERALAFLRSE